MATELTYGEDAAAGYERAFAHVSTHFVPFLLRAAHLAPDARVLDIASGTGLAAEAALATVGPGGHVTAADISPDMAEKARARFTGAPNAAVSIENGQSMSFPDESFNAVLCSLGLMFFPNPARACRSSAASYARAGGQRCLFPQRWSDPTTARSTVQSFVTRRRWRRPPRAFLPSATRRGCFRCSRAQVFRTCVLPPRATALNSPPSTPTSGPSSKEVDRPDRRSWR